MFISVFSAPVTVPGLDQECNLLLLNELWEGGWEQKLRSYKKTSIWLEQKIQAGEKLELVPVKCAGAWLLEVLAAGPKCLIFIFDTTSGRGFWSGGRLFVLTFLLVTIKTEHWQFSHLRWCTRCKGEGVRENETEDRKMNESRCFVCVFFWTQRLLWKTHENYAFFQKNRPTLAHALFKNPLISGWF